MLWKEMFNTVGSLYYHRLLERKKRERTIEKGQYFHCSDDLEILENGYVRSRME
jgi:hypothetical protein